MARAVSVTRLACSAARGPPGDPFRRLRAALRPQSVDHAAGRGDGEHAAGRRDRAGAPQRAFRRGFLRAGRRELALHRGLRLALEPRVTAPPDHRREHVVRELHAPQVQALLDAEQAAVDQLRQRVVRRAGRGEPLAHAFLRDALAVARIGEQLVLEEGPHPRGLVRQHALVELV